MRVVHVQHVGTDAAQRLADPPERDRVPPAAEERRYRKPLRRHAGCVRTGPGRQDMTPVTPLPQPACQQRGLMLGASPHAAGDGQDHRQGPRGARAARRRRRLGLPTPRRGAEGSVRFGRDNRRHLTIRGRYLVFETSGQAGGGPSQRVRPCTRIPGGRGPGPLHRPAKPAQRVSSPQSDDFLEGLTEKPFFRTGADYSVVSSCRVLTTSAIRSRLTGVTTQRILDSLHEGLESRVIFQFRYYEQPDRTLLGDRLVGEAEVIHSGSMDFFDGRYILETDRQWTVGRTRARPEESTFSFAAPEEFLLGFLSTGGLSLALPGGGTSNNAYVMARARLDYVKLDPPLNIITLFRPTATTTEWRRIELKGE